jgi:hypothetical protein
VSAICLRQKKWSLCLQAPPHCREKLLDPVFAALFLITHVVGNWRPSPGAKMARKISAIPTATIGIERI